MTEDGDMSLGEAMILWGKYSIAWIPRAGLAIALMDALFQWLFG